MATLEEKLQSIKNEKDELKKIFTDTLEMEASEISATPFVEYHTVFDAKFKSLQDEIASFEHENPEHAQLLLEREALISEKSQISVLLDDILG